MNDFNIHDFNEEDLNDPSLLAELAELIEEEQPIQGPITKEQPVLSEEQPLKIEHTAEIEEIGDIEVTEEDMNDPHLLAELMKVAGRGDGDGDSEPESSDAMKLLGTDKHSQTKVVPSPSSTEIETASAAESLESKLKLTNVSMLHQYVQIEKVSALNKKRNGDKDGAIQSLRNAKELQKRIEELQTALSAPKLAESFPQLSLKASLNRAELEERCLSFKKAAVSSKKRGNTEDAKEFLVIAKSIQNAIDTNDTDFKLPDAPISEISPTATESPLIRTKISNAASAPSHQISSGGADNDLVTHLISTLDQQITLCTKLSAQYFSSDQKDLALDFHKKKKNLLQDKETLLSMKSMLLEPHAMPFKFHYSTLEYTIAQSNPDIALDQVEVCILKGVDVSVKGESDPETGVLMDFGWPSTGKTPDGKFETKTLKGVSPEFNFKTLIKIERTKAFQRFLERKKASIELFHQSKSFFGILSKREVVGKAVIKLDDLLTKCEIHQFLTIMDPANPRKPTGAKLEISIKLRVPLLKTDVVKTSQKWLEVVFGSDPNQPPPTTTSTTQQKTAQNPIAASLPRPTETSVKVTPPDNVKQTSPTSVVEQYDIDDIEHLFLSPDNIASNAVLEQEHSLLLQRISSMHPPSDDLLDLKSGYEIKMQMLVSAIQMGSLDMPTYISQVKAAIEKTKSIALEFKKHGKLDLAKQAIVRLKVMTAEVDEVEQG